MLLGRTNDVAGLRSIFRRTPRTSGVIAILTSMIVSSATTSTERSQRPDGDGNDSAEFDFPAVTDEGAAEYRLAAATPAGRRWLSVTGRLARAEIYGDRPSRLRHLARREARFHDRLFGGDRARRTRPSPPARAAPRRAARPPRRPARRSRTRRARPARAAPGDGPAAAGGLGTTLPGEGDLCCFRFSKVLRWPHGQHRSTPQKRGGCNARRGRAGHPGRTRSDEAGRWVRAAGLVVAPDGGGGCP